LTASQADERIWAAGPVSAIEDTGSPPGVSGWRKLARIRPDLPLFMAALAAAAGVLGLFRTLALLWAIWTGDPLRSIGMLIPPVSVLLALRVWKQCGWERRGSWWGLPLILLAFLTSAMQQRMLLRGIVGTVTVSLIPVSTPLFLYGSGLVLLFAGWRVCRRAWFPILLLTLSQPVPVLHLGLIDAPLQRVAAEIARAFATLIGFAPTTPELRLMFSPHFGMFIAPGCDGIRGAVTMGYTALLLGYWKRVSILRWILYVVGAVLLGYVFNFVRLCLLVVYYRFAIGHRTLEGFGTQADYMIGFCLFAAATALFVWVARRKNSVPAPPLPAFQATHPKPDHLQWRAASLAFIVVLTIFLEARDMIRYAHPTAANLAFASRFPRQIGEFRLIATRYESSAGQRVLAVGDYAAPGSDTVMLGAWISSVTALHNANDCWIMRGVTPDSTNTTALEMRNGSLARFDVGYYTDSDRSSMVANTLCNAKECTEITRLGNEKQYRIEFVKPSMLRSVGFNYTRPVSFVIRIDRPVTGNSRTAIYSGLTAEAQRFAQGLDLPGLSRTFQ
jgi:exosortase J